MYYKLNRMYDDLNKTNQFLRFIIFMCIVLPVAFIPDDSYRVVALFILIVFRGFYLLYPVKKI